MAQERWNGERGDVMSRRMLMKTIGVAAGAAVVMPRVATAQAPASGPAAPPSTVTSPPRDFGPGGAPTTYFTDPDVLTVEPAFNGLRQPNAPIQRLWTGALWSEGPAWSGQGRYLVWSDIPNNRQLRWLEDDGRVSVFRAPSNNSNGNTFDFQGRQLSCEHLTRRVVRYELDGSVTVIADAYNGKRLNSPNDVVPHPDGSYWFTDPPYGGQLYEGTPDAPGGPSNRSGRINPRLGQPPEIGARSGSCRPASTASTRAAAWTSSWARTRCPIRTASCSRRTTRSSTSSAPAAAPATRARAARARCSSSTWGPTTRPPMGSSSRNFMVDGVKCGPDGVRCDVDGNLWCSSNAGRNVGYSGVTVWTPQGQLIGRIRLPEICGNVCFGGPKRNRLFMAASQSLYALYVQTQGAAPG